MSNTHLLAWPNPARAQYRDHEPLNDKMSSIIAVVSKSENQGVTTRDISDRCDMSIYSARNWLRKLEEEGRVFHIEAEKRKTLWFIKNETYRAITGIESAKI